MQKKRLVTIGHIVNDTEPIDHLGGPVSYAAVAATRLGYETHIITKCPPNHPYISVLKEYGISSVVVLPSQLQNITTNRNIYDDQGYKKQYKLAQQEKITPKDLMGIPKTLLQDSQILIGSDTGEVDEVLFPYLADFGTVSVIAQGYFRNVTKNKMVLPQTWTGDKKYMSSVNTVIFGDEDIMVDGKVDERMLEQIIMKPHITAFTIGIKGSMIFTRNGETRKIIAFPVKADEIKDFNGAGDIYAIAFITRLAESRNIHEAAVFASLFAGLKLMGFGGIGIDSIPTKEQMESFLSKNKNRVEEFYKSNNYTTLKVI